MGLIILDGGTRSVHIHGVGLLEKVCLPCLDRFKSLVHFEVKNGSQVLFWHDVWGGDQPVVFKSF